MWVNRKTYRDHTVTKKFTRQLVVATPTNERHGHFKTVVLVVADHKRRGTFGLCINRPAPECTCGECPTPPAPLFLGGPKGVDEKFFFIHDQQELCDESDKLFQGVYLSCPCTIERFNEGKGMMVTGYCQWKPGELEEEIKKHWWLVDPNPDPALILSPDPKRLWKSLTPRHYSMQWSAN